MKLHLLNMGFEDTFGREKYVLRVFIIEYFK